ncbi:hypothetical protein CP061683_0449A, partial [Chlamydia psittaci 06-1683]
MNVRLSSF